VRKILFLEEVQHVVGSQKKGAGRRKVGIVPKTIPVNRLSMYYPIPHI
jgi:hypothetical protein